MADRKKIWNGCHWLRCRKLFLNLVYFLDCTVLTHRIWGKVGSQITFSHTALEAYFNVSGVRMPQECCTTLQPKQVVRLIGSNDSVIAVFQTSNLFTHGDEARTCFEPVTTEAKASCSHGKWVEISIAECHSLAWCYWMISNLSVKSSSIHQLTVLLGNCDIIIWVNYKLL